MLQQYEALESVVPKDPDLLLQNTTEELHDKREKMIFEERLLVLFSLYKEENYPPFFPADRSEFFAFVSKPTSILVDSIAPQHIQFMSKLVEYFLQNPLDLTKVAIKIYQACDPAEFPFYIYSVFPAFLGYYSCAEHVQAAYQFYSALLVTAPHNLTFMMLTPFFCNACTYRYIESVANDVIQFLCHDVRLITCEDIQSLLAQHSKSFMKSIMFHLDLLPGVHANILKMMHKYQWSSDSIFQFFLNSFVSPQVLICLQSNSISAHSTFFKDIVKRLSTTVTALDIEPLFNTRSLYEIPGAFSDFSQPYLFFLLTPLDVSKIMPYIKETVTLPRLILMLQNPRHFKEQQYLPVWLKVFPKMPIPTLFSSSWRNVVFADCTYIQPSYHYPLFERRFRMLQMMAAESGQSAVEIIQGKSENTKTKLIHELKDERAYDFSGICDKCNHKDDVEELCDDCKELIKKREPISFEKFVLESSFHNLCFRAQRFELLLVHHFALERLKHWDETIVDCFNKQQSCFGQTLLTKFILDLSPQQLLHTSEFPKDLMNQYKIVFCNLQAQQMFFTMRVEMLLSTIHAPKRDAKLVILKAKWKEVVEQSFQNVTLPECFTNPKTRRSKRVIMNQHFMKAALAFGNISNTPFFKRYFLLMNCLKEFDTIAKNLNVSTPLIEYALKINQDDELIITILQIASTLMKKKEFHLLCTKEEILLWFELESIVLKFTEADDELNILYTDLHDQYISLF